MIVAFGSLIALTRPFGLAPALALRLGAPLIVLPMLAGASIGILLHWRARRAGLASAIIALLMLITVVTGAVVLIRWLALPGEDRYLKEIRVATDKPVPSLDAPDPSQDGLYEVATLFCGSGTDRHRPEYGRNVNLKTEPVDASALLTNLKGFKAWARRRYWGFEPNGFPLNARVWMPKGEGPLPLSHIHPLQPILRVTFTKWPYWEHVRFKSATEPVLQTFEIPLSDFVAVSPAFDPGRLKQIRFRFDRTRTAVILLDDVGFTPGATPIQN